VSFFQQIVEAFLIKLLGGTLRKYQRITKKILAQLPKYQKMSDDELKAQTDVFRQQLAAGVDLMALMVPAYAVVVEADTRVLGMTPYDTQILGAVAMQYGNVAEMRTGEGKTLMATMPMYLNGLSGPGNFLITANEYLANRDARQMGRVYSWLGLTIMAGTSENGEDDDDRDKSAIYAADVVYTTNSALGFDYLIDNLAATQADKYIQPFHFALLDEIDAVLLDMAQMPLIISGAPRVQSNLYQMSDDAIQLLTEDEDFERSEDTKKVWFTPQGIDFLAHFFAVSKLLDKTESDLYRHLVLALKAHYLYTRNRDYVVEDGEVSLLDVTNGRKLPGMKLESGLHQAIEAKEHVKITPETRAMASITYQNLFRMFPHLCGMTGTAKTDAEEFRETYNLDVVVIPTHKPMIRTDKPDKLFVTTEEKVYASLDIVQAAHKKRQPVLLETGSVSMSNLYSRVLLQAGIPHNLLNARSAAKEAQIVAEAGQPGAITVATSMAGRGTDIRLGKGVDEVGGLLVLGTERMNSERVDNQLRGRAGRQGHPGKSVFYVSLEDRILVEHAPKWVARYRRKAARKEKDSDTPRVLHKRRFRYLLHKTQMSAQNQERSGRFQTLQFDEVFRVQRESIYNTRNRIMQMDADDLDQIIEELLTTAVDAYVAKRSEHNADEVADFVINHIDYGFAIHRLIAEREVTYSHSALRQYLEKLVITQFKLQHKQVPSPTQFAYFERLALLKSLDNAWIEQVDSLQQLKGIVTDRSRGQRDPIYEYQKEARRSFRTMRADFALRAMTLLLLSQLQINPKDGTVEVVYP
jgi:preprotein translocase subunit SecA